LPTARSTPATEPPSVSQFEDWYLPRLFKRCVGERSAKCTVPAKAASVCNESASFVNKCLRDWQRSGIVRIDGNEIVIVKRDALEDVVQTG
jgi:hypothetical protein